MRHANEYRRTHARKIVKRLKAIGYDAIWAENKGGGYWIKGQGYIRRQIAEEMAAQVNI